jgi:hypothetical protein
VSFGVLVVRSEHSRVAALRERLSSWAASATRIPATSAARR